MTSLTSERRLRAGIATRRSVRVRPIRPTDGAAVLAMHERCSRETRHARWLGPSANFPSSYLNSLMAGAADHVAVVAVVGDFAGVIGLTSAGMTSDDGRELGILVEDHHQAEGVGRMMLDSLMGLLEPDEAVCACSFPENRWLLGKLARFGTLTIHHDSGLIHAHVERRALPQ